VDDEGEPTQQTVLIENGMLRGYFSGQAERNDIAVAPGPGGSALGLSHDALVCFGAEGKVRWRAPIQHADDARLLVTPGAVLVSSRQRVDRLAPSDGTHMAAVFASGRLWFKVPESLRINLKGTLRPNVMSKDAVLYSIGKIGADGATYMSVEFTGDTVRGMSMDSRMTMTNMAIEMGGKTGLIASDATTRQFLEGRTAVPFIDLTADSDASYSDVLEVEADSSSRCSPARTRWTMSGQSPRWRGGRWMEMTFSR
jgi:hypothetical protein